MKCSLLWPEDQCCDCKMTIKAFFNQTQALVLLSHWIINDADLANIEANLQIKNLSVDCHSSCRIDHLVIFRHTFLSMPHKAESNAL